MAEWDALETSQKIEPLADALARASRVLHGASRALVISDGFSCTPEARRRLLDLTRHVGVSVLVVADALEVSLAPPGRYPMEHGGERRDVVLQSERQRSDFRALIGAGPARLEQMALSLNLRSSTIDTVADPLAAVTRLLGSTRSGR
jgi:hypothetical protein